MKNSLSDIYEQVLLNEAEKHALQNPASDEVGSIKTKNELFGSKPKPVEGPDKAKLAKGPSYQETTGVSSKSSSRPTTGSISMKSAPASKTQTNEKPKEMKDTDVDPTENEEEEKEEKKQKNEGIALGSFEALFRKTLVEEENDEENDEESEEEITENTEFDVDLEDNEMSEEETDEDPEEGDLISDLKELQTKLSDILAKLEDSFDDEQEDTEEYTEEEFDEEFDDTENDMDSMKESVDKPKALNPAKGKSLMTKKNKIGKVNPKGGKAHIGNVDDEPTPKPLKDKKKALQKGKAVVKSSLAKGDFIK